MSLTTKDLIELVRKELNKYLLGLDTRMKIESEIESFEQKRKEWIEKQKNFKMGKKNLYNGKISRKNNANLWQKYRRFYINKNKKGILRLNSFISISNQ